LAADFETSPQSNLRRVRRKGPIGSDDSHVQDRPYPGKQLLRYSLSTRIANYFDSTALAKMAARRISSFAAGCGNYRVACVVLHFLYINFSSTPISILNLTISFDREFDTEVNGIPCVRKYCQFFTHESIIDQCVSVSVCRHCKVLEEIAEQCQKPCQKQPLPVRHMDFHLTHECLGPPHSPCQTTARSLYALPHNDATKSPLVTMDAANSPPKLPLPLRRSPPKSNTPHPTQHPKRHPHPISCFATIHMCGQTRLDDMVNHKCFAHLF